MSEHEDARRIRAALTDPRALCSALGLLEGPEGHGKGCAWRSISGGVQVCCPSHDERTPSCSVTRGPDGTVRVHCFGCSEGGDALSLVAAVRGLDVRRDFARVLDEAADVAGIARPSRSTSTWSSSTPARPPPRRATPARAVEAVEVVDDGVMEQLAAVLRERAPVTRSPDAMEYLRGRCIDHGPALGWFALPAELEALNALRVAVVDVIGLEAWRASGLSYGPNGEQWRRRWRGRLVIPWEDPSGAVRTLEGRALSDVFEGGKYEQPEGRGAVWPWGCAELRESSEGTAVAFVEGAVDAHSFNTLARESGRDCVALGLPGVGGWRDEWARLARGRDAVIALDADKTGQNPRNVERLRSALLREARSVDRWKPAAGKDWNDTLRECRAQGNGTRETA